MSNKKSTLGFGIVLGTIIGGLAAFFLSPKSGKENREMAKRKIEELKKMLEEHKVNERVQEIYGEVTKEGEKAYLMARDQINKQLDKMGVDEVDREKYISMVDDVIDRVKAEMQPAADKLAQLKEYFMKRWGKLSEKEKKTAKKT